MKLFSKKTFLTALCALLILCVVSLAVDYRCVTQLREPVFAMSTGSETDDGETIYMGLGYTVECRIDAAGTVHTTSIKLLGIWLTGFARGEVT